jgi:predicted permease
MSRLVQDVRHALRACVRAPLVSTLAIVAFALGIGVTTVVFSVFSGVLLEPLPFPRPDELVVVYDTQPACATCPASFPKYHDWKARNTVFAAIAGLTQASFVLTGHGDPVEINGAAATASLVDVFGVPPILGRWFTADEDRPGGPKVVVLTHAFWAARFNRDASVLGRRLLLDEQPYEVIGVMPERYFTQRRLDFFVPLARPLDPSTRGSHFLPTFARLKPGVTVERAATEMRALGRVLAREFGHNHGIDVRSYYEVVVGNVRGSLQLLMGAVLVVLLIGCANVANLLLASGLARRRELGIRLALGARALDLGRQLALESLLLAAAGALLGVLLAAWALRMFVLLAGDQLPRAAAVGIDGRVLAFVAGVTVLVGLLCGLWPLLRLRASELATAVREADTRTGTGTGGRVGGGLVVAEVALAFTLLVGGGLLVKNLVRLQSRDAGIRAEGVIAFDVAPSGPRYEAPDQKRVFYRELYSRLAGMAGVQHVGFISHLPMYRFGWNGEMSIDGKTPWGPEAAPLVEYRWFHGRYFEAVGVRLVRGRLLDDRDREGTTTVVINEAMARKFWPGQDAIGRRFGQGSDRKEWYEVVGIVSDVRSYGLARPTPYEFYRSIEQDPFRWVTVVLRPASSGDPGAFVATARRIVGSLDPTLPVTNVQTLEEVVAASVGRQRLISTMTAVFASLAALLAMVGVYGVMVYNVRRQRRELGIRLALGADRGAIGNLVVRRGLVLAVSGSALGLLGAWLLSGTLKTLLDDVAPTDPGVFATTAAVMLVAALLAAGPAAWAASRVDPMIVLRDQ